MRHYLVIIHRWSGLVMAAFLIVVGLTGALLPFSDPLERLINPQLFARAPAGARPLDLATLAERAEAQEPRARVAYFGLTIPDQVSIHVVPRKDPRTGKDFQLDFDHVLLDPFTGAELGRRMEGDLTQGRINIVPFILTLHESLAMGNAGAWVLGVVALLWTLDCFLALYLTLPRGLPDFGRRWIPAWLVKKTSNSFRLNFDLHRATGLWMWPMLLVFAWSSVMFNLEPVYDAVTRTLFDYTPIEESLRTLQPSHPNLNPKLNWSAAQARGVELVAEQAHIQGFHIVRPFGLAYLPELGVYDYDVRTDQDVGGRTFEAGVWLDGNTGALQKVFPPLGPRSGDAITTWLYALHWADFHDLLAYRIFVSALGLLIVALSVTGVAIWWIKRRARLYARTLRERRVS